MLILVWFKRSLYYFTIVTSQRVEGTRIFPRGGDFGFQVTGMIEWGQISKPKTILCRISEPYKSPERKTILDVLKSQKYAAGICGHYHVLNSPENPCLTRPSQKYLPNFTTQKTPGIENFKPCPCYLKSGVPP